MDYKEHIELVYTKPQLHLDAEAQEILTRAMILLDNIVDIVTYNKDFDSVFNHAADARDAIDNLIDEVEG